MFSLRGRKSRPHVRNTRRPSARPLLEALEGRWAPAVLAVTTAADSGPGSLRQALLDANAAPGLDTINFAIGSGAQTIMLSSPLPPVTDPVVLDGTTQPGWAGLPLVTLDGHAAGATDGLDLVAGTSAVRALTVTGFAGCGIAAFSTGVAIQGNFLVDNGLDGVALTTLTGDFARGPGSGIGGNLLSGNGRFGAYVYGNSNCTIQSNRIGTNADGTAALPNALDGVVVTGPGEVRNNTVALNLISGNGRCGALFILAGDSQVVGNDIGTNAAGTAALPNGSHGVYVFGTGGSDVMVGGAAAGQGNLISGNGGYGVLFLGLENNDLEGNKIGTDGAGTAALPNATAGVGVTDSDDLIGGAGAGEGNLIAGNHGPGVLLAGLAVGTLVQGNTIGGALGNSGDGVLVAVANGSSVGGTAPGAGNVIAGNGRDGVRVLSGTGNGIQGNSIHDNAGLGIDLGGNGVTPNDSAGHVGPNNYQNFPVLTAVAAGTGGGTDVSFTLDSTPSTAFRVEFFANAAADPSGFGEGQTFLGFATATTDAGGHAAATAHVAGTVGAGQTVTATATGLDGTSEFSADFTPAGQPA
ncbi:MAG TPA: right-handed parallel beta-helix repeat-containing protein [Gemmataceae bacterium]|nr:right-handed parallel beta-helix repeat-containing protein [Gemmataceae bacterium]